MVALAPAILPTLAVGTAAVGVGGGVPAALAGLSVGTAVSGLLAAAGIVGTAGSVVSYVETNAQITELSAENATQFADISTLKTQVATTLSAPSATATPTTTPTPPTIIEAQIVPDTPTPCGDGELGGNVCP